MEPSQRFQLIKSLSETKVIKAISAGNFHNLFLTDNGEVLTVGYGAKGRIGPNPEHNPEHNPDPNPESNPNWTLA